MTVDNTVGVIFSGHFDKKIRMWDARTYKEQQGIEVQGKVTSLDISSRGKYAYKIIKFQDLYGHSRQFRGCSESQAVAEEDKFLID